MGSGENLNAIPPSPTQLAWAREDISPSRSINAIPIMQFCQVALTDDSLFNEALQFVERHAQQPLEYLCVVLAGSRGMAERAGSVAI